MTASIEAPGFLTDPGEAFLAAGMTPLPDGEPSDQERHQLEEAAIALAAAFLVLRHHLSRDLANTDNPRPDQVQAVASGAWKKRLPLWFRLSTPVIIRVMAMRAPQLSSAELDQLALDYCLSLGDYLDETSGQGLALGFTRQLGERHNEKLAWARASNAYGLGPREMFTYISGIMRAPAPAPGQEDPAHAVLNRLLLQRADKIGANETWRALQSAKTLVWAMRYAAGQLPPGTQVEWDTREDERTCAACGPMDHQRVAPGEAFTSGEIRAQSSPLHPGCRCETRLIVPSPLSKSADELRDARGRWATPAELATESELGVPPVGRTGGVPAIGHTGGVPAAGRMGASSVPPLTAAAEPAPSASPAVPPLSATAPMTQVPPLRTTALPEVPPLRGARAFGPKPKKAKKPKAVPVPEPAPAPKVQPAAQGKLVAMPAKPEPAARRRPVGYMAVNDATARSVRFSGLQGNFYPGAVVTLGDVSRLGSSELDRIPVSDSAIAQKQVMPSEPELDFWRENVARLVETRTDAAADVERIAGKDLSAQAIRDIYHLAGVQPGEGLEAQRSKLVRDVGRGVGSTLADAYADYITYADPQAAGGAGMELAEAADFAGVDTVAVPALETIAFDAYAEGDSVAAGVRGKYVVERIAYTSFDGATPGIAGKRVIHLRPASNIEKRLSGFGISHAPASVTGGPRDA